MNCTGVLVPCVNKALQFVAAAESWSSAQWSSCAHVPVSWCTSLQKHSLSAGWAFTFRESLLWYASRHDSTSELLLAQGTRLKWKAGGWMWLLWWCVCWHKLRVNICSRAETAIFHWNTSLAVFQCHGSKKQGHNCWYWVESYGSCWFPNFFLGLLCISSSLLCQIVWQCCCWNTADEVCDQTLPLVLESFSREKVYWTVNFLHDGLWFSWDELS